MESPRIAVDPKPQSASRQSHAEKLVRVAAGLPTLKSDGVMPEHYAAAAALVAKTRSLLLEAARAHRVCQGAAGDMGGHEQDSATDVSKTPVAEYKEV